MGNYDEIVTEIRNKNNFSENELKKEICANFSSYLKNRFEKMFKDNDFTDYLYENWDKIVKHISKDDGDLYVIGVYNPIVKNYKPFI